MGSACDPDLRPRVVEIGRPSFKGGLRCCGFFLVLLGLCLTGFGEPALADDCATPRLENTVKMEPLGDQGKVAVPIILDGKEKKFLLDTGGGAVNYVSSALVRNLRLATFYSDHGSVDLQGHVSDRAVIVNDVAFGAVEAGGVPFDVAPDTDFDGILSAGALANDDLDIDFGAMRLNFFSADHCDGDVVYWPHKVLAVVPVTPVAGHIEFQAALDGRPLRAIIDTGAPWTTLNIAWAEKNLGFSLNNRTSQANAPRDDPRKRIFFGKYFALFFPGVTVTNPLMIVRPIRFDLRNTSPPPDVIIGMEVLKHLHIYYAVKAQKLYITPATEPSLLLEEVVSSVGTHAWPRDIKPPLLDLAAGAASTGVAPVPPDLK